MEQADTRGCASLSDTKCLCNDPTYVSETVKCFEQVCKGTNLEDAVSIGESVCLAAVSFRLILFYFEVILILIPKKTYSRFYLFFLFRASL